MRRICISRDRMKLFVSILKVKSMKAVVLTGLQEIELRDLPDPERKSGTDVLLKMAAVGVCGSDIHYYTKGRIGDQIVQYPFIVGHEGSAIVKEVGNRVTRVKPGDPVVFDPLVVCGQCSQCLNGRRHTCLHARFLGCPDQREGCLSEYIVMPEECCYPIPSEVSLTEAVLVEPLSIGIHSVKFLNNPTSRDIGVLGVGPIGLSVSIGAQRAGVQSSFVTDKIEDRLNVAKKLGADWTGNPDRSDIVKEILEEVPDGLDAVFECCGDQDALDQAVHLLKPGGSLFIVGIPEDNRISFDINLMRRKEICIQNVRRQNECIQAAIDLFQSGRINTDALLTHRFPFEEARAAFELVANYRDGVVKAVIEIG